MIPFLLIFGMISRSNAQRLSINETYFETVESKYYNQAIEIHNRDTVPIDLSAYRLIAGELVENVFVGSRTNEIIAWSSTKQTELSNNYTHVSFSSLLPPGETAVILDPGYRLEEKFAFTNLARTNILYLLTASTGVLGTGNFMKEDNVLKLVLISQPENIIDEFHNQPAPEGYGVVKIDDSKKGLPDNTASRAQTIGYIEDLHDFYTTLPPDRLGLDEIGGNNTIVGLPQVYNLTCKYLTAVSQLCNRDIGFNRHDYIKMYHYPKDSANLITDKDVITLTAGQSAPITLFALEPGLHRISTADNSFPPVEKTVLSFDHPQAAEVFITEIYYNTNKDLTWMEVYSKNQLTLPIRLQTFNSDYRENNDFDLGTVTLASGYNVLGYRNQDFDNQFPPSDPVILIPSRFAITTEGMIALSSGGRYLDVVHYNKNWFEDLIDGRSLQRIALGDYAFTKAKWNVSTEADSTPFAPNILTRNIDFTIDLASTHFSLSTLKIHFLADFNAGGKLTVYLYDSSGYRIGKVFSQDMSRGYRTPLFVCLKEVKNRYNLYPGEYSLMFVFDHDDGKKTLYRNFILE